MIVWIILIVALLLFVYLCFKTDNNKEIKTNDMIREDLETVIRRSSFLYKSHFIQNGSELEIYPNEVDQFYKLTDDISWYPIIELQHIIGGYLEIPDFECRGNREYFKLRNKITGEEATVVKWCNTEGCGWMGIFYSQREVERKCLLEELGKKIPEYVEFDYDIEKEELMVWHKERLKETTIIIPKIDLKNINNYLGEINMVEEEIQREEQDKKYKLEYIKNAIHGIFNED